MNSSDVEVDTEGSPRLARLAGTIARSKRPLLAMIKRSVVSRKTGFVGDLNEPHAQLPDEPRCLSHTTSPRNKNPSSSCKIVVMSEASERNGRRPKLATLTTMRPPGSSTRWHSAKTSVSISRYST